ncbi:MAG: MBL fold metallo-hydrolase RNA specificity domain-containing protein [Chloroflexota bacterium]
MTTLTFYGGINEIGGNKILLEDDNHVLLLDFGFPYKRHKLFYEEYLKPRSGAGLLDPLTMGLLPLLEGIYREDLQTEDLWGEFRGSPLYRKLDQVDGILLSHAHLDHSGHISFLKNNIPVYSTAATAFIAKAIQDSGKSDFDQQVCYFNPATLDCPTGWKQMAFLSENVAKQQRQFCVADIAPDDLSQSARQFWSSGFWEKTPRQKELASCALLSHTGCALNLRCFPVDHSIPGACAWAIETSAGWVIYSGDLRLHGKRAALTSRFVNEASALRPRALILEGTNIGRATNVAEHEVYDNALRAIASSHGLVIADFPARDVDRLLTFLQIARDTGKKLAILSKDAYLLKTMRLLEQTVPDIATDENVVIYQDTIASRHPSLWMRNLFQEYVGKTVLASDVSSSQDQFILCFSFFDLNELPSIRPKPGSLYLFSSSEPHDEEQEIDFRRLHSWLEHFELKTFGLPTEKDGEWQIPDGERGLHASGHACGTDLLNIVWEINPGIVIPIHSEQPHFYADQLAGSDIRVVLPTPGKLIQI